jgi:hypothetical protein
VRASYCIESVDCQMIEVLVGAAYVSAGLIHRTCLGGSSFIGTTEWFS